MKISYAITVCNEFLEIQRLLNFLIKNKRYQDEITILFDSQNGDKEIKVKTDSSKLYGVDWKGYEPPVTEADKGYWYKINDKPATKTEYIKYQNKPGGDEPGKQTNDPTVSLAKQSADKRIKLNK